MNRIIGLMLILFATMTNAQLRDSESSDPSNSKQIIIDTVHRVISDSVTMKALENTQKFYSDSFSSILWLIGIIIAIGCAIFGSVGTWYWWKAKKYNEEIKKELEETKKQIENQKIEFTNSSKRILELEKELKEKIEKTLEADKKKNQEKFDTSFRFLSRIYRKSAEEYLEKDKVNDFFYYIHIFYRCLIKIDTLNRYDFGRLDRTHKLLLKKKTKKITLENELNICWFTIYLLKLIKHCDDNGLNSYCDVAKSIYNDLFDFNFNGFTYDGIIRKLKDCMKNNYHEDSDIQETLKLAEYYKNAPIDIHI